ncbi:DUF3558 family protein [Pseudonocardia petroleophila]|uniref:DUF3558 family protein n=2 Tax=Pseudonocardia petroleophila TaxID=37331 RepID=A0A7G7MHI2_9PSEU|nr:DUF3558 family protein [Pseudonocardia petroleophila]QNG52243.1 DUF3558 family protein [Pseudonocardia petroleophila]
MRMITMLTVAALVLAGAGCARGASGPDLGAVAPCDLLTPAQVAAAGLGPGRAADAGPVRSCSWRQEGPAFTVPVLLTVAPGAGLDEFRSAYPGGEFVDDEIGGFAALRTSGEGCSTVVDVGSGVLAVAGAADCDGQREIAELALANLPG